jgi:hypothetical protein
MRFQLPTNAATTIVGPADPATANLASSLAQQALAGRPRAAEALELLGAHGDEKGLPADLLTRAKDPAVRAEIQNTLANAEDFLAQGRPRGLGGAARSGPDMYLDVAGFDAADRALAQAGSLLNRLQ